MTAWSRWGLAWACLSAAACSSDVPAPSSASLARVSSADVGGCACPGSGGCSALSYGDIPSDNTYLVTTFGGGSDTQSMSCGGTADGTWAYIANRERFGCDAKVKIEGGGKSCIAQVADCGPNKCVEEAACYCSCGGHVPIIDASPFITEYLFGMSGVGWSDKVEVKATVVDDTTAVGCPGGATGGAAGSAGAGGAAGQGGSSQGGEGGVQGEGGATAEGGAEQGGEGGAELGGAGGEEPGTGGNADGCIPGQQRVCTCPGAGYGTHVCNEDGLGFGPCKNCLSSGAGNDDGGCGCREAGASGGSGALLLLALPWLRRRRRG